MAGGSRLADNSVCLRERMAVPGLPLGALEVRT